MPVRVIELDARDIEALFKKTAVTTNVRDDNGLVIHIQMAANIKIGVTIKEVS